MWRSDEHHDDLTGLSEVQRPGQSGVWRPCVDVYETGRACFIKADLPGFARQDIALEVHDGELIMLGRGRDDHPPPLVKYHLLERGGGQFARKISLPDGLDLDMAEAFLRDGVLSVVIPKKDQTGLTFKVEINVL